MHATHRTLIHWRILFASFAVLFLLLLSVGRGDNIPYLKSIAGAYEQDLVRWEITHFMDKWLVQVAAMVLPGGPTQEERLENVELFFAMGNDMRDAKAALAQILAAPHAADPEPRAVPIQTTIEDLRQRRSKLQAEVEETLESAMSGVLSDLRIIDNFGPISWPPVDFTFEDHGLLLVRSPRDSIARLDDLLLDSNVPVPDQMQLETDAEGIGTNISALVVRIGGVATYPAQISPERSLHGTLEIAAHEWLHHWLIFRPLGQRWANGGELQSINETLANIFGQEVGDLSLGRLTGKVINRPPWTAPAPQDWNKPSTGIFDFRREMRASRTELERLLAESTPHAAETYLETRRLEFVANGYNIRRLNNAWFAFNGTYADSPASISPIEAQLRNLRTSSPNLAAYLDSIAAITKRGQLEVLARQAGWEPLS
jgi:hypothetical protein